MTRRNERIVTAAIVTASVCVALLCVALTILALQMREMIVHCEDSWDTLVQHAVAIEQDLDDTVNEARGAVKLVPKVVNDTRLTLDNANKAAIDERMYFEQEVPGLMARVNMVVDQSRGTLAAYQKTGEALTAAAQGLQPVESSTSKSLADLDTLIANPHWETTLANFDLTSASTAETAKHLDGTAADVQGAVHAFVHPGWKTRLVNWISQAAHTAGGWF